MPEKGLEEEVSPLKISSKTKYTNSSANMTDKTENVRNFSNNNWNS